MEMRTHRHKCADLGTYLDPEMVHIWNQKLQRMRTHRHDCANFGTYLDPEMVRIWYIFGSRNSEYFVHIWNQKWYIFGTYL